MSQDETSASHSEKILSAFRTWPRANSRAENASSLLPPHGLKDARVSLQPPEQMHALFQHLRYTLRLLRKSPGFTITAVLILSFGIGVNTAIFSLLDAAMLKPLPYPDSDRLVEVCTPYQKEWLHWIDYPDYLDLAAAQHSFENMAALTGPLALDLGGTKEAQQVRVFFVSPGLAKVTGLPLKLGRWFNEEEDVPHGPLVAVLSEPFWRSQFHSDPNIVGKNVTLSGWCFQIVGVAALGPELRKIIASIDPDVAIGTICTYDEMIGDNFSSRKLSVLMVSVFSGAALFLSAIGLYGILAYSVNQRTREIGIRIALGASSTNILRLIIQRGLVMVGIGLIIGILIALVCSRSIESLLYEVRGDDPVTLGLAVLVLCAAGLIACLLPACRAVKVDPIAALRQ